MSPTLSHNLDSGTGQPFILKFNQIEARAPQETITSTTPSSPSPSPSQPAEDDSNNEGGLAKAVLEYLFLGVALAIILAIIYRRLRNLKRANQPASSFFNFHPSNSSTTSRGSRTFPRTTGIPTVNIGQPYPYPDPLLADIPTAYTGYVSRRTRAADIDASGRRVGDRHAELDHDGGLDDKDVLPAYEHFGGPPKYNELEMQARLSSVGNGINSPNEHANPVAGDAGGPTRRENGPRPEREEEMAAQSPAQPPELDTTLGLVPSTDTTHSSSTMARRS
ncbi:hypothetical protein NLJ89_g8277 [Agrocybe chaxingu]|uniref:Uncharacterized protein n=1 Tax=Agrocybe chaxingu TaxID=84603 RepID=A0A9W8MQX8_9AGAR|nr:hypothetical protein NLJ89_g8277 [Agrocybe chaxingu]